MDMNITAHIHLLYFTYFPICKSGLIYTNVLIYVILYIAIKIKSIITQIKIAPNTIPTIINFYEIFRCVIFFR